MSILYVVATPIGNLADITLRAVRVLKESDYIICEDTRVTKKLLSHLQIEKKTISFHAQSSNFKLQSILDLLKKGQNIALVTDAGTPTISDPGMLLVKQARQLLGEEISIVPIPGASALTAALSVSGLPSSSFLFLGFLPHKKGRESLLKEVLESRRTTVLYESPHRILKTLEALKDLLGKERRVVVCRELTKIFEEVIGGTPGETFSYFQKHAGKIKGEFVVVVSGR